MEKPYANREIDRLMDNLTDKLEEHHTDVLEKLGSQDRILLRIENQTTLTNGRVTSLEYWRKYVIIGLSIVIAVILAVPKLIPEFDPLGIRSKSQQAAEKAINECILEGRCLVIEEN